MKELSIEQKAKAYDEAIERAKEMIKAMTNIGGVAKVDDIQYLSPELKESEDERIRESLLEYLHTLPNHYAHSGVCAPEWIAWLEKQGEKSVNKLQVSGELYEHIRNTCACIDDALSSETLADINDYLSMAERSAKSAFDMIEKQGEQKHVVIIPKFRVGDEIKTSNEESLTITKIDGKGYWSEDLFICNFNDAAKWELVEQKSDDKVEPKFRNGQWIVWLGKCYKVNYNGCGYELVDQDGLGTLLEYGTIDKNAHLWSIADAKKGDVVVDKSDGAIGIFQSIGHHPDGGSFNDPSYCFLHCRYDDGYFFADFEHGNIMTSDDVIPATKEQRDTLMKAMADAGCIFDFEKKELKKIIDENQIKKNLQDNSFRRMFEQKPAWSEEDSLMIDEIIFFIQEFQKLDICKDRGYMQNSFTCINWLKSLRPQNHWKPSEEQLKSLKGVIDVGYFTSYPNSLEILYEQLNKLKE